MGNELDRRLERTAQTGVFAFVGQGKKKIPEELWNTKDKLRTLDLSGNRLTNLPDKFCQFVNLRNLSLSNCTLVCLPDGIGDLVKLETLALNNNRLKALPPSFSKLINLKKLDLSDNEFAVFPVEICCLIKLDVLALSKNKLKDLSEDIVNLKAVTHIDLNNNQLTLIHPAVADLTRLKVLKVQNNKITLSGLPDVLFTLSPVHSLDLQGNPVAPDELSRHPPYEK
eukprot:Ihof_evm8s11 gene=Ihof_evmTU8s11